MYVPGTLKSSFLAKGLPRVNKIPIPISNNWIGSKHLKSVSQFGWSGYLIRSAPAPFVHIRKYAKHMEVFSGIH